MIKREISCSYENLLNNEDFFCKIYSWMNWNILDIDFWFTCISVKYFFIDELFLGITFI